MKNQSELEEFALKLLESKRDLGLVRNFKVGRCKLLRYFSDHSRRGYIEPQEIHLSISFNTKDKIRHSFTFVACDVDITEDSSMVEHLAHNEAVPGSNPGPRT